jgi:hypothetical protein
VKGPSRLFARRLINSQLHRAETDIQGISTIGSVFPEQAIKSDRQAVRGKTPWWSRCDLGFEHRQARGAGVYAKAGKF